MELVQPSAEYKDSFIQAVEEFLNSPMQNMRSRRYEEMPAVPTLREAFPEYVANLLGHARGENLPEGYVPSTEMWLVDGKKFVGAINIRHRMTPHLLNEGGLIGYDIRPSERGQGYGTLILKLALPIAKELGMEKVLVTCDDGNIPSRRVIEANGGVFEDKRPLSGDAPKKLRYWIEL